MTTAIRIPIVEVPADPRRGLGLLEVLGPTGKVALPLAGVAIRARVVDRIAEVEVEQRFKNGFPEALEATYVFPLGGAAAVSSFAEPPLPCRMGAERKSEAIPARALAKRLSPAVRKPGASGTRPNRRRRSCYA